MSPKSSDASKDPDPKAQFKQALERKRGQQAARNNSGGPQGDSKIHGEHGASGGGRMFRRKSGG
ncbi:MAG TPA: DUF5302 domain-containing protein [Jatrophihabitantaceae bacterium]|nr:DUF5302 domain-containing protein [Jatrophihabitantaceae bacterium]